MFSSLFKMVNTSQNLIFLCLRLVTAIGICFNFKLVVYIIYFFYIDNVRLTSIRRAPRLAPRTWGSTDFCASVRLAPLTTLGHVSWMSEMLDVEPSRVGVPVPASCPISVRISHFAVLRCHTSRFDLLQARLGTDAKVPNYP